MRVAYHTYAFGGRGWLPCWTLEESLRLTAELGFDGLELAANRPHGWPEDLSSQRRQEIVQIARSYGLEISAVCFQSVNHNLASPVPEERQGAVAYLRRCLQLAADLECRIVTGGGGWSVQPYNRQQAWDWTAEGLTAASREAETLGVTLALENINDRRADVVVTPDDQLAMLEAVGSPALQVMIDFYHLHLVDGDPLKAVQQLKSHLVYVHLLDARKSGRARVGPGLGELPLPEILACLRETGYDGWLGYENWGDDPLALGRQAIDYYKAQGVIARGTEG